MKENRTPQEILLDKVLKQKELLQPYMDIFKGQEVPRAQIHPVFDDALAAGFEANKLSQRINEYGDIVVFKIDPPKRI